MNHRLLTIVCIILLTQRLITSSSAAKIPDDGYSGPAPPPVDDGYDAPQPVDDGYDVPPPVDGYDAPDQDPCFSYDTDNPFNDIQPAPYAVDGAFGTKSVQECQQLCQDVYDCNFFVYDTRVYEKKCWLKTGKGIILPPTAGTVLGPKFCDGYDAPTASSTRDNYEVPDTNYNEPDDKYSEPGTGYEEPDYKNGCFSKNTDSAFFDLSLPGIPFSKDVYSAAKCQQLCQKHDKCKYFVHDRRDGQKNWCWLKTAAKDKKSVDGTTLGPKYCDGYNAPGETYQEPTHSIQVPNSSYEEPADKYEEPDPNYEEPTPISPRGAKQISDDIRFPEPGA